MIDSKDIPEEQMREIIAEFPKEDLDKAISDFMLYGECIFDLDNKKRVDPMSEKAMEMKDKKEFEEENLHIGSTNEEIIKRFKEKK